MNYNEDKIKEHLSNQSQKIDTDQLWQQIKHHAPIKRRRNWVPFFFAFIIGGILTAAMIHNFFPTQCLQEKEKWIVYIDSLSSENKNLEKKLSIALNRMNVLKKEIDNAKNISQIVNHHQSLSGPSKIPSHSGLAASQNVMINTAGSSTKTGQIESYIFQEEIIKNSPFQKNEIDSATIINLYPVNSVQKRNELPSVFPKIYLKHNEDNWKYHVNITAGMAFFNDKQINNEGKQRSTSFSPFLSYSADIGVSKKIKGRFSFAGLINYSNMVYSLNYKNKQVENISLVDTTEVIISSNGIIGVNIGSTGGIKITEQKGKIHGYQRRISIIPTVYYQSLAGRKIHLFHGIGLGLDLLHISKNIIPTYDERSFLAQSVNKLTFNPYVSIGTQLEYIISKDFSASLLLQCTYRNENYNFSSLNGTRSSIFPSLGLGLTFN